MHRHVESNPCVTYSFRDLWPLLQSQEWVREPIESRSAAQGRSSATASSLGQKGAKAAAGGRDTPGSDGKLFRYLHSGATISTSSSSSSSSSVTSLLGVSVFYSKMAVLRFIARYAFVYRLFLRFLFLLYLRIIF